VVASWLILRRHDRRLCEQCVAALPLNPSGRAAGYRFRFRLAHLGSRPDALAAYFAVLVGTNFIPGVVGKALWTAAQLSMIYLIRSYVAHRRLQPWCPWCSDGAGGSELIDDPVAPLPDDRHQLV